MSNVTLFACGGIHQGQKCFREVSRGRWWVDEFIGLKQAVVYSSKTIDNILLKGKNFYWSVLANGDIPDAVSLSVCDLPFASAGRGVRIILTLCRKAPSIPMLHHTQVNSRTLVNLPLQHVSSENPLTAVNDSNSLCAVKPRGTSWSQRYTS